ncbi:MAG: DNA repair protein RecO [Candidatus Limivivens sp.]|nr:DNA repair protein RecO [Candidatus Limivivens sp.]
MSDMLTVTGLVLSAMPVGDYDKRLVLLTRERGKITAFARGVRRQNSPLLAAASPFAFGQFSLFPGRDAYRLVQAEIQNYFRELSQDFEGAYYGFYFLEFADYYTRENAEESQMLKLLYASLRALTRPSLPRVLVRYVYELKAMVLNGEYPEVFHCTRCGREEHLAAFVPEENGLVCRECLPGTRSPVKLEESAVYALQFIVSTPIEKLYTFTVSKPVLEQIARIMERFRKKWVDHTFKSLEILESIPNY